MAARDPGEREGRIQSVDRAAALLAAVADAAPEPAPVALLAARTGINRTTAWRLLATLEDNALVERRDAGYVLGAALARLAEAASRDALERAAHPVLARVATVSGETASLAVARRSGLPLRRRGGRRRGGLRGLAGPARAAARDVRWQGLPGRAPARRGRCAPAHAPAGLHRHDDHEPRGARRGARRRARAASRSASASSTPAGRASPPPSSAPAGARSPASTSGARWRAFPPRGSPRSASSCARRPRRSRRARG